MFASTLSYLSWNGFEDRHWTAPAFGYASVACSLTAIVLGAQHLLMLNELREKGANALRDQLTFYDKSGECRLRRVPLYIWQIPVQCLAYSVVAFIAGLMSFIFSPLAHSIGWDENANVS
jgi:hypothetical protein